LGHVKLRLTAFGEDKKVLAAAVEQQIQNILPTISNYVYGYNEETLETAIGKLLKNSGKTLALAESCSGGYISHLITTVPGSSNYLRGTVVPYHNDLKQQVIGVSSATLAQHGAVSEETVLEMATGVKKLLGSDYGLASSGIAGPDGGSPDKPVGTVWIACAGPDFVEAKLLQLTQDRLINIQLTGVAVLNLLRICFLKHNK
jgi:nicotinamide-nucleotide amidase